MNIDVESEAATAPTVTASESENPVDQSQVADSDEIVTGHPFDSKPGAAVELAAPETGAGIASGSPEPTPPDDQQDEWEKVDEGEMPFTTRGTGHPRKTVAAGAADGKIVKLPLDKLLAHPLNKKLYGATAPGEIKVLAQSIADTGQLVPLVVTADLEKVGYYALLSGHKRADALRSLGRTEANCQVVDVPDADERLLRLLEANRQHVPTTEQKIRIGEVYFELETKKAKARQVAGAKAVKKDGEVVEVFTQPAMPPGKVGDDTAGKARDLAAAKVGMSGVSFDKGRKVLRAIEKAEEGGKKETAAELRQLLNEKGIEPAHERAKVLHLIEQAKKSNGTGGKAQVSGGAAKGANTTLKPAVTTVALAENNSTRVLTTGDAVDATNPAEVSEGASPAAPKSEKKPAAILDDSKQPPGIRVVTLGEKFIEGLEETDVSDLTADLKRNLRHTLDNIGIWRADHDQMLKLPGEL